MARFQFILWLAYWYTQNEFFEFEWDSGNLQKSKDKHDVSPNEIETLFQNRLAVPLGRQISPEVTEERLCLVGPTTDGRMISVVFTLRDGRVRPISGRDASRKERKLYEEVRKTLEKL
jgi:uncharacterized DUF497 family protein